MYTQTHYTHTNKNTHSAHKTHTHTPNGVLSNSNIMGLTIEIKLQHC